VVAGSLPVLGVVNVSCVWTPFVVVVIALVLSVAAVARNHASYSNENRRIRLRVVFHNPYISKTQPTFAANGSRESAADRIT